MPSKEHYLEQIAKELAMAAEAARSGNDGRARVCARRAAGQAITWFVQSNPRPLWLPDAMSQLHGIAADSSFPPNVREAAVRLTTKISDRFTYPFSTDPIADARILIDAIQQLMNAPDAGNN